MKNQFEIVKAKLFEKINYEGLKIGRKLISLEQPLTGKSEERRKVKHENLKNFYDSIQKLKTAIENSESEEILLGELNAFSASLEFKVENFNTGQNATFFQLPHEHSLSNFFNEILLYILQGLGFKGYQLIEKFDNLRIKSGSERDVNSSFENILDASDQAMNKLTPNSTSS